MWFFIALLSKEYLSSSNCKDELNYARDLEKPRLLVYLENIKLPGGMQMRLSRLQAIHRYKYCEREQFYEKLFASSGISICCNSDHIEAIECSHFPYKVDKNISTEKTPFDVICNHVNPDAMLRLIFVLDTSGSMFGDRICQINNAMQRIKSSLSPKKDSLLTIDILQFDTHARWKTLDELPLQSSGITNWGEALMALRAYGNNISQNCSCAIVFTTDGDSTDLYGDTLQLLQQEKWFYMAVKTGIAIGSDANAGVLASITGSQCAVVSAEDIQFLPELLGSITIASVQAAQKNAEQKTSIEGRDIIDWLDNENVDEELKWIFRQDGTLEIISGAIIPDFYRPHPQTPWAEHRDSIRKVIFRQGLRIIGMHAFYNLPNLEEIKIPFSVTNIRAGAFGKCPKLRSVSFSRKIFEISDFKQKSRAPEKCVIIWPGAFEDTPWDDEKPSGWGAGTEYAY